MKKVALIGLILILLTPVVSSSAVDYNTIPEGEVWYSATHYKAGQSVPTGFDEYGYNYQGHMFCGSYFNSYAGGYGYPPWEGDDAAYLLANPLAAELWCWPYRDVTLKMKWNDAWISNVDHDGDHYLDRHWGYLTYDGSGAWLTNHQSGAYEEDGVTYAWNYFVKIVTPSTADGFYKVGSFWYSPEDVEVGEVIWGEFAVVQRVYNDQGTGEHGTEYVSEYSTAFSDYM